MVKCLLCVCLLGTELGTSHTLDKRSNTALHFVSSLFKDWVYVVVHADLKFMALPP